MVLLSLAWRLAIFPGALVRWGPGGGAVTEGSWACAMPRRAAPKRRANCLYMAGDRWLAALSYWCAMKVACSCAEERVQAGEHLNSLISVEPILIVISVSVKVSTRSLLVTERQGLRMVDGWRACPSTDAIVAVLLRVYGPQVPIVLGHHHTSRPNRP